MMTTDASDESDGLFLLPKCQRAFALMSVERMDELPSGLAVVGFDFVRDICHDMCRIRECNEHNFKDADGKCLIVGEGCPYYVEAMVNDKRNGK